MLPAETPKLAKWPFLLGDALLLGTAWLIADQSRNPFTGQPLVWIVVCVVAAAILGAVPFLADYARKQDEALDERQRGLDAISRTVASSAEQISIAANGLHELTELAQRNLKAAGQLGPGLEEKVAALKAELAATRDDERAALRKEIAALRAAETHRVETAAQQLAKTAAEILRAESALQKEIAAARELCAATGDLAVTLNGVTEALHAARTAALAAPAPASSATPETATEVPAAKPESKRARKSAAPAESLETPPPTPTEFPAPEAAPAPAEQLAVPTPEPVVTVASPAPEPVPTAEVPAATPEAETPAPARKRAPRKPRPEAAAEPALEIPVAIPAPEPAPVETPAVASSRATAIISGLKSEISDADAAPAPAPAEAPPADSDEPAKAVEQSRSSDGATRLLVTAYIGIGNRLFIRGDGPGLSWEKGLPLQFVSIGKWRWESSDATGPVKYKLYKNDAVECTALGEQQVDPGQQQEVAAAF
jgi:hypothetical protein